jgi:hypothetical protein
MKKIEEYKNDILRAFLEEKNNPHKSETSEILSPIYYDIRKDKLNHIPQKEFNELCDNLIDEKLLIKKDYNNSNIKNSSLDIYISLQGEQFIKLGGYGFVNTFKKFFGRDLILVIIGAIIAGIFIILGAIIS